MAAKAKPAPAEVSEEELDGPRTADPAEREAAIAAAHEAALEAGRLEAEARQAYLRANPPVVAAMTVDGGKLRHASNGAVASLTPYDGRHAVLVVLPPTDATAGAEDVLVAEMVVSAAAAAIREAQRRADFDAADKPTLQGV